MTPFRSAGQAKQCAKDFFNEVSEKDFDLAMELTGRNNIRSLFDYPSSEYNSTSIEEKVGVIVRIIRLGYDIGSLKQVAVAQIMNAGHPFEEAVEVVNHAVDNILNHILRTRFGPLDELARAAS